MPTMTRKKYSNLIVPSLDNDAFEIKLIDKIKEKDELCRYSADMIYLQGGLIEALILYRQCQK